MTIHVETPDHGKYSFESAIGWQTCSGDEGDEGNLSIFDEVDSILEWLAERLYAALTGRR